MAFFGCFLAPKPRGNQNFFGGIRFSGDGGPKTCFGTSQYHKRGGGGAVDPAGSLTIHDVTNLIVEFEPESGS